MRQSVVLFPESLVGSYSECGGCRVLSKFHNKLVRNSDKIQMTLKKISWQQLQCLIITTDEKYRLYNTHKQNNKYICCNPSSFAPSTNMFTNSDVFTKDHVFLYPWHLMWFITREIMLPKIGVLQIYVNILSQFLCNSKGVLWFSCVCTRVCICVLTFFYFASHSKIFSTIKMCLTITRDDE